MKKIRTWQWIVLGIVSTLVLAVVFFHAHWFSYEMGMDHFEREIIYPFLASVVLLPITVAVWIFTIRKKKSLFPAMLISVFYIGALLCILGGFHGGCPVCGWPPDRVYQWLHTLKYGHPLECTW